MKAFKAVIAVVGETPYAEGVGDIRRSGTLEHARRHPEDLAVLERVADRRPGRRPARRRRPASRSGREAT